MASLFIIQEMTGDQRTIEMAGRCLPFKPYELETNQRAEVSFKLGNPIGTVDVYGPEEVSSKVSGMWRTQHMSLPTAKIYGASEYPLRSSGLIISSASDAVKLFDDLLSSAQLLTVTWFTQRRVGILSSFKKSFQTEHDVEWTLEFLWASKGDISGATVLRPLDDASSGLNKIKTQGSKLFDINIDLDLSNEVFDTVVNVSNAVQGIILDVENSIVQLGNQIITPVNAAKGLLSAITSIDDELERMLRFIDQRVLGALTGRESVDIGYSEALSLAQYRRDLRLWAREFERLNAEIRSGLESSLFELLAVHRVRSGETLRSISVDYYGSPNNWQQIMLFNGLTDTDLRLGARIDIPKLEGT